MRRLFALLVAVAAVCTMAVPAGAVTYPGYYWAGDYQWLINANGVSVGIDQAQPIVAPGEDHSLAELWVADSTDQQQIEVGWVVNGANNPATLFVFHWVNNVPTCYNGCGFVNTAPAGTGVGYPVTQGQRGTYEIFHNAAQAKWWVIYNGVYVGYFPDSIWGGAWTKVTDTQTFGEVSAPPNQPPCSDMGDGVPGSQSLSTAMTLDTFYGSSVTPVFQQYNPNPFLYNTKIVGSTLRFGGSGGC